MESGGFLEKQSREYLIRSIARTTRLEDLQNLVVASRDDAPVLLRQLADVHWAPRVKRGDASFNGRPAVVLSVQKQPQADTIRLTAQVEQALDELWGTLPPGTSGRRSCSGRRTSSPRRSATSRRRCATRRSSSPWSWSCFCSTCARPSSR